jgi:hypothetical protein
MKITDWDFLIIGAAKCATTWLQVQLQAHPSIYMPDPELHYFSREYQRDQQWYLDQFLPSQDTKLIGEKSNTYLSDPKAAKRIHDVLPDIQLVAQLRNPIDRAYSDYCMLYRRGDVGSNINDYLDPTTAKADRCIADGNYAEQIQPFIDLYGKERLLVLDFENVKKDPSRQVKALLEHLNINAATSEITPTHKVKDKTNTRIPPHLRKQLRWLKPLVKPIRNTKAFGYAWNTLAKKPDYPPFKPELRNALADYYAPSISHLEDMTGLSLKHWV